jgi:hypothetical protein
LDCFFISFQKDKFIVKKNIQKTLTTVTVSKVLNAMPNEKAQFKLKSFPSWIFG